MCVDVWTGDVERDLSWELEAKATTRISIPLRKFNIAEKGAGEVCCVSCTLFSVPNLIS